MPTSTGNVITYSSNTWAFTDVVVGADGKFYAAMDNGQTGASGGISVLVYDPDAGTPAWTEYASFGLADASISSFSDDSEIAVTADGHLHIVFKHEIGSGVNSTRGVMYGEYDGSSWSFAAVEQNSHPNGWLNADDPRISIDGSGTAHVAYSFNAAESHDYFARYANNSSGSFTFETRASYTSDVDSTINEIITPSVYAEADGTVHFLYLKEDGINFHAGNLYYQVRSPAGVWSSEQLIAGTPGVANGLYYGGSPGDPNDFAAGLDDSNALHVFVLSDTGNMSEIVISNDGSSITNTEIFPASQDVWGVTGYQVVNGVEFILVVKTDGGVTPAAYIYSRESGGSFVQGEQVVADASSIRFDLAIQDDGDYMLTMSVLETGVTYAAGAVAITTTNAAPTLTGAPADVTVTEDTASNLSLSGITVADSDGDTLTMTLTASAGTLTATSGGSVTVGGSGSGVLTLSGTAANINAFLDTAANVNYTGASNVNGNNAATLQVKVSDNTTDSSTSTINLDITAVNDAPTGTGVPATVTVAEDTASNFNLSALTVADVDGDTLTVTVAASAGTFAATSGGSVTVGGSGTGSLTLNGTAANINTFLDTVSNIKYTGASNVNGTGAATFTVNVNDSAANPQVGSGSINITAVNDAPTGSGTPATVTVTEDTAGNFDLSNFSVADVDGDALTVTVAASSGTFAATSGGSVVVGGSGTGSLTLTGSAANINAFLDTATNIKYTGALNVSGTGAATFTIHADDSTVNPQVGSGSINITGVNDAPTGSGTPTTVTVVEDVASNFDLSALTVVDVDGDTLTVTIAASAGTFAATSGGSVTIGGSGTGTLTLNGTAANINTFLDTASNIKYTGAENVNGTGAATFTVNAYDGALDPQIGAGSIDITAVNDPATGAPQIDGKATSGRVLTASIGTVADVDGIDTDTFVWQWMRDGVDLAGANDETYKVTTDDIGHKLSVELTFTDLGTTVETLVSDETSDVARSGKVRSDGNGNGTLLGTNGDDVLNGNGGADVIRGRRGDDVLFGGPGDDVLFGNQGNDTLFGGDGIDVLFGNVGHDRIVGGRGNDFLHGGLGNDTLNGGRGQDVFVFGEKSGHDVITDFWGLDRIQIVEGAKNLRQLDFAASGSDVVISYGNVKITVEDTTIAELRDADNFIFG